MIKNKVYILGGLILAICIIATILITKSIIQRDNNDKIEELERQNRIYQGWSNKLKNTIDSLLLEEKISEEKTDSIKLRVKDLEKRNIVLETEYKKIRGRYKNYSSDSLYKELMKRYYEDISINPN